MKTAIIDFVTRHYSRLSLAAYLTFPFYFAINLTDLVYGVIHGFDLKNIIWYAVVCICGVILIGWSIPYIFRDSLNVECQKPTSRDFCLYLLYLITVVGLTFIVTFVPAMKDSYFQASLAITMNVCEIIYMLAIFGIILSAILHEINPAHQNSAQP